METLCLMACKIVLDGYHKRSENQLGFQLSFHLEYFKV
jgi:hypothetical protein